MCRLPRIYENFQFFYRGGRLKAVAHFRVRPLIRGFLPIYVKIFRATAYVCPKRQKIAKIVKNRKKWSKIAKIVKNRQKIAINRQKSLIIVEISNRNHRRELQWLSGIYHNI